MVIWSFYTKMHYRLKKPTHPLRHMFSIYNHKSILKLKLHSTFYTHKVLYKRPMYMYVYYMTVRKFNQSLSHDWSNVLVWVVCGQIFMKVFQDTQVHLTILEGRTLPASTHKFCWTCTAITGVSLRDFKTYAALAPHSKNP